MNWRSAMMAMVVAPLLLCGIILLLRQTESAATKPLGVFLILGASTMGPQIIGFAGAYDIWPWLTFFPFFYVELWLGPLLIWHAHALMTSGPLGWKRWLILPGLSQTLYYTGAFLLPGSSLFDTPAKWAFNGAVHEPYIVPVESLMGIALLGLAIVILWRDRTTYLSYLEQTESAARDYDPVWLRNLIIALSLGALIYAAIEIVELTVGLSYPAAFPALVLLASILTWIGLDAAWRLTTPFPKMDVRVQATDTPLPQASAPPSVPVDLGARIRRAVIEDRWFLEPRLSIRDVAQRLGTNESYVSRTINATLGDSFNQFVNSARIDHARTLLQKGDLSVLSVAMESGFNSKATFNRVFRDIAGMTPTQFRRHSAPDF